MPCKTFINQSCGRTFGVGAITEMLPLNRLGAAADFLAAGGAAAGSGTDLTLFADSSIGEYGLAMIANGLLLDCCVSYIYIYMFVWLNDECLLLIVGLLTYYAGCMHMFCACCLNR